MTTTSQRGMGWIPDLPDSRDNLWWHTEVREQLHKLPAADRLLPDHIDLRYGDEGEEFFAPAEDQGPINCSSACAILSLLEYFERRLCGNVFYGSHLFLYKLTRSLRNKQAKVSGDTGADLRTTLKALKRFGSLDASYYPTQIERFDEEPSPFQYQLANPIPDLLYFRVDSNAFDNGGQILGSVWDWLMTFVAAGFPIAFGFAVPTTISMGPDIHLRPMQDTFLGGQAAVVIGYRLHHFGRNRHALLIRTSWGPQWGNEGTGWLSADFVHLHIARNFWTMLAPSMLVRSCSPTGLYRPRCLD